MESQNSPNRVFKESSEPFRAAHRGASRVVYRRRISTLRAILVGSTISVALIFFVIWYKSWPNQIGCNRLAVRTCAAMNAYLLKNDRLPPFLETLNVKPRRYSVDHFEYLFEGVGGPGRLPNGTVVAYCVPPHYPLFSDPWRNVLIYQDSHIAFQRISDAEFKKILAKQPAPEFFYKQPHSNVFAP